MIDLFRPYIPPEAADAVVATLKTRWIGQGPKVDEFEAAFSELFRQPHCVSVNSGTSALETAYDLLDLGPGDEVISSPLTCTATHLPLLRRGVRIVWADVEPETLCADPEDIERKMTERTRAVIIVNLAGIEAARPFVDVPVIADSCQALGIFNGDYNCCSFQGIKHITTGDGGMITLPTAAEAHTAKLLRWFGVDREKKIAAGWQCYRERQMTFDIEVPGTKRHLTDLAATLGLVGLAHYGEVITYRTLLLDLYREGLDGIPGIRLVDGKALGRQNMVWLCTVLAQGRDALVQKLHAAEIETNLCHLRNDIYKIFGGRDGRPDPAAPVLPVLDQVEPFYLYLPMGMHVTPENVRGICETIRRGW